MFHELDVLIWTEGNIDVDVVDVSLFAWAEREKRMVMHVLGLAASEGATKWLAIYKGWGQLVKNKRGNKKLQQFWKHPSLHKNKQPSHLYFSGEVQLGEPPASKAYRQIMAFEEALK